MDCDHVLSVNRQTRRLAARPSWPILMSAVWTDWQARTSAPIFLTYDSHWLCLASDESRRQPLTTRPRSHSPNSWSSVRSSLSLSFCLNFFSVTQNVFITIRKNVVHQYQCFFQPHIASLLAAWNWTKLNLKKLKFKHLNVVLFLHEKHIICILWILIKLCYNTLIFHNNWTGVCADLAIFLILLETTFKYEIINSSSLFLYN